jgi:DNA-binding response OmpR family regulator
MHILVVDDDPFHRRFVTLFLSDAGHTTSIAGDAASAAREIERFQPDLILLDVRLPDRSGFDFMSDIRGSGNMVPVIFVTTEGHVDDRLTGLSLGADDYIAKPFVAAELMARVTAVLRRTYPTNPPVTHTNTKSGPLKIDLEQHTVTVPLKGKVELTDVEFRMLRYLTQNPNRVLTPEEILTGVWGSPDVGDDSLVQQNIRRLRNRIELEPDKPKLIKNVYGKGYKFVIE